MRIMATFDGSGFAESVVPQLEALSPLPDVEFLLLFVADMPEGKPSTTAFEPAIASQGIVSPVTPSYIRAQEPPYAESKEQAVERKMAAMTEYLDTIGRRLPRNTLYRVKAVLDDDVSATIIRLAEEEHAGMIVMATHGETGLRRRLFGHVTERVVQSGVAPVLLVSPHSA